MKVRIKNISVELDDNRNLNEIAAGYLKVDVSKILDVKIILRTIDARRYNGAGIKFNYILDVEFDGKINLARNKNLEKVPAKNIFTVAKIPQGLRFNRPVVAGFGPAGMFAALTLARAGLQPLIFERGGDIDSRAAAVSKFFNTGELDTNSNIQFGEGGAGTFSDGKLTARTNDNLVDFILETFVQAGAPSEILYLNKPHIGTDNLREVVKNIRREIIKLGGQIFFNSQVTDLEFDSSGNVTAAIVNGEERFLADAIFLGVGHSARDTYEMLNSHGVAMESKAFAVGVRIEHPQEFINRAQYGEDFKNEKLPVADYFLTYKDSSGRGAYSFCMCPGGVVVAATSEIGRVVTNGMSNFSRNSGVANSALLVTVDKSDFKNFGGDNLSGVRFQRYFEKLAFELGGKNYSAPVQSVVDFLNGRADCKNFLINPTYPLGYKIADLNKCLPAEVSKTLKNALIFWNGKIKDFAEANVALTGIETRTSAPCRILRDKINLQSVSNAGIYPIGEGAGYAGGIMSSAIDGIKAAQKYLTLTVC